MSKNWRPKGVSRRQFLQAGLASGIGLVVSQQPNLKTDTQPANVLDGQFTVV